MAERTIKLSDVGEGVAEAELVEWMVAVGDVVAEDQTVAAVMTDKATVEIPTPVGGRVLALGAAVGQNLAVGAELIRIDDGVGAATVAETTPPPETAAIAPPVAAPAPPRPAAETAARPDRQPARDPAPAVRRRPSGSTRPLAAPALRRRALEAGIDLRLVPGSGPAGRITDADLARHMATPPARSATPAPRPPETAVEEIRLTGMRRRIAENMAEASRRIAHFSYVEEVDVTALEDLRAAMNAAGGGERPKLTLLPFLVRAITRTVPRFPQMNAHFDDEAEIIRRFAGVHVGIATQTPSGLMVPVVRHAETRGLHDCAGEILRLAEAARSGRAERGELTGSTITISSLGALGGLVTTPVVNRPEVAIIGVNKLTIRPVWQQTGFVPRKVVNLSSSFDHRVIDGYDAAQFIQAIRALLETPALLFVED